MCPAALGVGRTLLKEVASLKTDQSLLHLLGDYLAKKAAAILSKRAASNLKYVAWCQADKLAPFPITEGQRYADCKHLASSTSVAPATISSFSQAVGFIKYSIDFEGCQESRASSRIAGASHNMLITKKPLKQKAAFTARHIGCLSNYAAEHTCLRSHIAGSLLFCVYARARWRDHLWIEELVWDVTPDGSGYVQGNSRNAKTSVTAAHRTRFLPLTAPLRHLGPRC